jgi:hypothetical protein
VAAPARFRGYGLFQTMLHVCMLRMPFFTLSNQPLQDSIHCSLVHVLVMGGACASLGKHRQLINRLFGFGSDVGLAC